MGRKRRAGSLPLPLVPSFRAGNRHSNSTTEATNRQRPSSTVEAGLGSSGKKSDHGNYLRGRIHGASDYRVAAPEVPAAFGAKRKRKKKSRGDRIDKRPDETCSSPWSSLPPTTATPVATLDGASASQLEQASATSNSPAVEPLRNAPSAATTASYSNTTCSKSDRDAAYEPPSPPKPPHATENTKSEKTASEQKCMSTPSHKPTSRRKRRRGVMTPSEVQTELLPRGGWRLSSCWAMGCDCTAYHRQSATSTLHTGISSSSAADGSKAATLTASYTKPAPAMVCACGHRSVAHELVDVNDADANAAGPLCYSADGYGEVLMPTGRLRQLFLSIRNARAVGDCGLFTDSDGVCCWGAGWFLSRLALRYIQEARQSVAELGHALHDAPAVLRCLLVAEKLMSGDATGDVPKSLPLTSIYQALGTSIASELDVAYWHVRYTAASSFNAGGVGADAPFQVVPPPEVYFVCLSSHVPSAADLREFPDMENSTLRKMLDTVFDLSAGQQHSGDLTGLSEGGSGEVEFPVMTNPLLAVVQAAWLETAISAAARSWVPQYPPRFGEPEGTMRGSDPALPTPIRARCDAVRDWSARLLAFAVPNQRAVEACNRAVRACGVSAKGIVEVGAGLGYWKWALEGGSRRDGAQRGRNTMRIADSEEKSLRVLAIDKDPSRLPGPCEQSSSDVKGKHGTADGGRQRHTQEGPRGRHDGNKNTTRGRRKETPIMSTARSNEYHGGAPAWAVVDKGGPDTTRSLSSGAYPVLLLCYPPPSVRGGGGSVACMGVDALATFSGMILLYVGEIGGDTGSPRLEARLRAEWDMVEDVELPCFSSTANRLMVFIRKNAGLPEYDRQPVLSMHRCSGCRAAGDGVRLHRCRLTRAVSYCSENCLKGDLDRWRAHLEARHVYLQAAGGLGGGLFAHRPESSARAFRDKKLFKRQSSPASDI